MKKGYEEYQVNQIETADARELVIMLYDGAIRFLEEAVNNVENFKKYDYVNARLLKVQDILTELMVSLDMDRGGEIADNLLSLYVYMKKVILEANMKKEKAPLEQVLKMLRDLKSAWDQLDTRLASIKKPETENRPEIRKGGFIASG